MPKTSEQVLKEVLELVQLNEGDDFEEVCVEVRILVESFFVEQLGTKDG